LSSISPDLTIAAQIAFEGGYDPCNNATFFLGQDSNRKKRAIIQICDKGFVADEDNGYCYLNSGVIEGPQMVSYGKNYCNKYSCQAVARSDAKSDQRSKQLY